MSQKMKGQNRLRRVSTDSSLGAFNQNQSEFNRDKKKKYIYSNDSLSPSLKKRDFFKNKMVFKKATISEEPTTNFSRGALTRISLSNDQQIIKKIGNNLKVSNQSQSHEKSCQCAKILIVDDNEFNLYVLELRLKEYSYEVDKANCGLKALEMINERFLGNSSCCKFYGLIFMDIDMPIKNGNETTIEIIQFYKSHNQTCCPISACTAFVSEADKQIAKNSGMTYYLTKPIISEKLQEILQKVFK